MDGTQCCSVLRPPYCLQAQWSWATLAVAILLGSFLLALLASAVAACCRRPPRSQAPQAAVAATATEGQAFEVRPQAEEMYQDRPRDESTRSMFLLRIAATSSSVAQNKHVNVQSPGACMGSA